VPPSPDYNRDFSERRARAAADAVASQGIARGRLITSGKGEDDPIASNIAPLDFSPRPPTMAG
jgi:outer membrane protein OmpA-like peptidoglycan-associated protein